MKKILFILFFPIICYGATKAEKVNGTTYNCDTTYHCKDFTGHDFSTKTIANGTVIFGSCFSRETPDSVVFKSDLVATFVKCNLDNVRIPAGCTVIQCSQKTFKVQNDGCDWLLDAQLKPVEPINKEMYLKLNLSIDPNQIPAQKQTKDIITKTLEVNTVQQAQVTPE